MKIFENFRVPDTNGIMDSSDALLDVLDGCERYKIVCETY